MINSFVIFISRSSDSWNVTPTFRRQRRQTGWWSRDLARGMATNFIFVKTACAVRVWRQSLARYHAPTVASCRSMKRQRQRPLAKPIPASQRRRMLSRSGLGCSYPERTRVIDAGWRLVKSNVNSDRANLYRPRNSPPISIGDLSLL